MYITEQKYELCELKKKKQSFEKKEQGSNKAWLTWRSKSQDAPVSAPGHMFIYQRY